MATSGPGWEGIDEAWDAMDRRRGVAQDEALRKAAEETVPAAPSDEPPPP